MANANIVISTDQAYSVGFDISVDGVVSDQWYRDLADYLKDNVPSEFNFQGSVSVSSISVTNPHEVTPNP